MQITENNYWNGVTLVDLIYALLQMMFIYLKITEQIDWTWLQVASPTITLAALLLILFGVVAILQGLGFPKEENNE